MILAALLQESGNGKVEPEIKSLLAGLGRRGVPCGLFLEKQLARRRAELGRQTLVAGHIPVVLGALRQLGIEPPQPDDYPDCLRPWLHRRVWRSVVGEVVAKLQRGDVRPFFAKPLDRHKRFRGHVFESWDDLRALGGVSDHAAVVCSSVVEWRSEYRFYVVRGEIVGMGHYAGDVNCPVDRGQVEAAVACYTESGRAPGGYGIDFGVLATGETALVEVNDGYSLGSYRLDDDLYTDLIVTRWMEMTAEAEEVNTVD